MENSAIAQPILIMVSDSPRVGKIELINERKTHKNTVMAKMRKTCFSSGVVGPRSANFCAMSSLEEANSIPWLGNIQRVKTT